MAAPLPPPFDKQKTVAENRRARFDYFVEERFEAGIQLTGTEVKSLRQGEGSIAESYATVEGDATAHVIAELASRRQIKSSRIAHGVPVGGELEYVDGGTLAHALAGRQTL